MSVWASSPVQSVANKGEPFLSSLEPDAGALRGVLQPHGLELAELLHPR